MITYAEYLKSQGASDEDIKLLDTAIGRKAYEAMATQAAADAAEKARIEANAKAYEDRVNAWYEEQNKKVSDTERELVVVKANEARARKALMAAQEQGLLDVAKDLGYEPDKPTTAAAPNLGAPGFDPNRYFTRDEIVEIATREGDAIAIAQDIAAEHRILFPDKPLKFRELRAEAQQKKVSVEQLWMDRFGVAAAREAQAKAARDAEVSKLVAEQVKVKEAEFISRYGNPDARPLAPSTSPLTARPATGREKQPWDLGGGETGSNLQQDRVKRATEKVLSASSGHTN